MAHNKAAVIFDTHLHEYVTVENSGQGSVQSRSHRLCDAKFFDSAKEALEYIAKSIAPASRNQCVVRDVVVLVLEHTTEGDEI